MDKEKEEIVFRLVSILKFRLELTGFNKIYSKKKWIQKGIEILEKRFPSFIVYLSKQAAISNINNYKIVIESEKNKNVSTLKKVFIVWVEKELGKRLFFLIIEGIILPFTPVLALLPGPNIFFYVPALFFFYHYKSFRGLKKLDFDELDLEIKYR